MRPFETDARRSARMSGQRSKDTSPELALRRELFARGLRYFVHRRPEASLRRTADVVFPRHRVAVFVDGCFWHGCPEHGNVPRANTWYWPQKITKNQARDRETDRELTRLGWTVVRVWEHEDPPDIADRIEAVVRRRATTRGRRSVD